MPGLHYANKIDQLHLEAIVYSYNVITKPIQSMPVCKLGIVLLMLVRLCKCWMDG